jgi:Fe2+ transport system protein FeoA
VSRSADHAVRCPLCGHRFDPDALTCHAGCPLGSRCGLICCPRCGYETVDGSRSRAVRLLWRSRRRDRRPVPTDDDGTIALVDVPDGMERAVVAFEGMDAGRSARLSAFGLVPGARVRLLQRRPAPVIRLGEMELALSEEIVSRIRVAARP